jgi:hypothetical protein
MLAASAIGKRSGASRTQSSCTSRERQMQRHCKTSATSNRYKAFISLCYREGIRNGKVTINPARLVRHRREGADAYAFSAVRSTTACIA